MSSTHARVIAVNIGPGGIPKHAVDAGRVTFGGLEGDGHDHDKHNTPMQALSLLDIEDLNDLRDEGFAVSPGATGENITCEGLECDQLEIGDQLKFSGGVVAEYTKRRTPCFVLDSIDPTLKKAALGRIGGYARIISEGVIKPGETIEVVRASAPASNGSG